MNVTVLGIITSVISALISGFLAMIMKNVNDDARRYREQRKVSEEAKAEEQSKREENEKNAMLAIMRTMLKDNADRCFEKGSYTVEEREVYHEMYEVYTKMGGNGIIKDMGERLRELPYE